MTKKPVTFGQAIEELGFKEAARLLGRRGGEATSRKKAKASRQNGKLGGRPRKAATERVSIETRHGAWFVRRLDRQPRQRHNAAQFSSDFTRERVVAWVLSQPRLVLVEP